AHRATLAQLARRLAQQVVGYAPRFRTVAEWQHARAAGAEDCGEEPEACVLEAQQFLFGGGTVAEVLAKVSQGVGAPVDVVSFVRFERGEGVEKAARPDFAEEHSRRHCALTAAHPLLAPGSAELRRPPARTLEPASARGHANLAQLRQEQMSQPHTTPPSWASRDEDEEDDHAAVFVPVFTRKRTASMQALRGFDIEADDEESVEYSEADGGEYSDADSDAHSDAHSECSLSRHAHSLGTLATLTASKVSADGALSTSDSSTVVLPDPLAERLACRATASTSADTRQHARSIQSHSAQTVPPSPSVPLGASMFWLRSHGFERPWDPLFAVHWAAIATLVGGFTVAAGLYLRVAEDLPGSHVARWRALLAVQSLVSALAVAVDVAITLRNVEAPEVSAAAQAAQASGIPGRGRNAYYVFERGVPVVDS
ncbi:Elongation factor Ts, mitochondrial, partial [Coemansia sp. RSA 486]